MLTPIDKKNDFYSNAMNINKFFTKRNDGSIELLKNSFELSIDYNEVYTNMNYHTKYKVWIYEGNEKDKVVGYKYLQSYPYEDIKFEKGDYIHWYYGGSDLTTWLLISLDKQYLNNIKGRMMLCNNTLKWNVGNIIKKYPCVIEDEISYTNYKYGNNGLVEQGGDIVVLVKKDNNTSSLLVNDRFIFNGRAFRIKQKLNELNSGFLEIYMSKVSELQNDDLINNIAKNDDSENIVIGNNTVISPIIDNILENDTNTFSVYKYVNSIKQSDRFSIVSSNVPDANYELTIIDDNNFSIKNLKQYTQSPLILTITNLTTSEILTRKYWLEGKW